MRYYESLKTTIMKILYKWKNTIDKIKLNAVEYKMVSI